MMANTALKLGDGSWHSNADSRGKIHVTGRGAEEVLTRSYSPTSVARWSGRKRQSVGASFSLSPGVTSFSFMA